MHFQTNTMQSILLKNIKGLGGILEKDIPCLKGKAMSNFEVIENAFLRVKRAL